MSKELTSKRRSLIFIGILISVVASSALSTAFSTALVPIMTELNIDAATGQWLTSSYSLVMGIVMPVTAFLIIRIKTKPLYLSALTVLAAGLIICTFAGNFWLMLLGRILQAAATAMLSAMGQVLILTIYPPERRGTIMGWYGLASGVAPAIAPTLAALLIDSVGWRMIFVVVLAVTVISLGYNSVVLRNELETRKETMDWLSFALSIPAFGGISLGIGNITKGFGEIMTWLPLTIGVICLALFILRQLRKDKPFLDIRTLGNKRFAVSVICGSLLYL
ncbi:MAG: MFS transporter, partial [Synergistes sp.]|nr:MFS transporter [Synergistes sp.]